MSTQASSPIPSQFIAGHFQLDLSQACNHLQQKTISGRPTYLTTLRQPQTKATGYYLPHPDHPIKGLRFINSQKKLVIVARRKQINLDAVKNFPEHPHALHSGFRAEFTISTGTTHLDCQVKDTHGQWHTIAHLSLRLPFFWKLKKRFTRSLPQTFYQKWCLENEPDASAQKILRDEISTWKNPPLISILCPVYNTPLRWLDEAIQSVCHQLYPHWELCLVDDGSPSPEIKPHLTRWAAKDKRIRCHFSPTSGHICAATNQALEMATGEFCALLDHDDLLPPWALYHVAKKIITQPQVDLIFSDEDKIDEENVRYDPYFKPAWNYDLFLQENCFSHLGVIRTQLLRQINGFRIGYHGSQDWDLILRAAAQTTPDRICHLPHILYHWRTLPTSTSANMDSKPYAVTAALQAIRDELDRTCPAAQIENLSDYKWRILWPLPDPPPRVSLIMLTKDRPELLTVATHSLFSLTQYPNFELILIDHDTTDPQALSHLHQLEQEHPHQVRREKITGPFNWSAFCHHGANLSTGQILVFINNDIEIIHSDWLTHLVRHALRPDVGAVGALLLYPNRTIQHAGVVLGLQGLAGHIYAGYHPSVKSCGGTHERTREVTAVTGACLATRRDTYFSHGGFDAEHFATNWNDIDYCLRLRQSGLKIIYTPDAELIHHESATRKNFKVNENPADAYFQKKWAHLIEKDPFFNPNLSLQHSFPCPKNIS